MRVRLPAGDDGTYPVPPVGEGKGKEPKRRITDWTAVDIHDVYHGQLYILDLIPGSYPKGGPRVMPKARCLCACGRIFVAQRNNVLRGRTKSCNRGTCAMRNRKAHSERTKSQMTGKTGERHPGWKGENVGYAAAHFRVRRARGKASEHTCVDCGKSAAEYSYQGNCPDEKLGENNDFFVAYCPSAHEACMVPRCRPCHRQADAAQRQAKAS